MKKIVITAFTALIISFTSCNVIDQDPIDSVSNEQLFKKGSDANAAIIGAYRSVLDFGSNYTIMPELPTKNVKGTALNRQFEQMNNLLFFEDNGWYNTYWAQCYLIVSRTNVIIERVKNISDPAFTESAKATIMAEAHMLRAFAYFNLVRAFGDVPLIIQPTSTPDLAALQVSRDPAAEVYNQIFADLDIAKRDLPQSFSNAQQTKGRVTKNAAYALAVRIHMHRKEFDKAAEAAAVVLADKPELTNTYAAIFETQNTDEAIWELQYDVQVPNNTASTFLPAALGGTLALEVNPDILAAYEEGDLRKSATLGIAGTVNYMKKYTRRVSRDDHFVVFRLAEVILSRAEALAEQSYPNTEALTLLNKIRTRADLPELTAASVPDLASFKERLFKDRRLELAYEGHEWFDLVRTDRIDDVLGITDDTKKLWPIPAVEQLRNSNLTQNPGYN